MKRIARAIAEIDSARAAINRSVWQSPTEMVALGLLNTAKTSLLQFQLIAPPFVRGVDSSAVDKVAILIAQVNDELGRAIDQLEGEDGKTQ